jgi:hypothetical protein
MTTCGSSTWEFVMPISRPAGAAGLRFVGCLDGETRADDNVSKADPGYLETVNSLQPLTCIMPLFSGTPAWT